MTTVQQNVPPEALSRVMSYVSFGAYAVGPIGLAAAGPLAELVGIPLVLAVGVGWQLVATSAVLATPAVRGLVNVRPTAPTADCPVRTPRTSRP